MGAADTSRTGLRVVPRVRGPTARSPPALPRRAPLPLNTSASRPSSFSIGRHQRPAPPSRPPADPLSAPPCAPPSKRVTVTTVKASVTKFGPWAWALLPADDMNLVRSVAAVDRGARRCGCPQVCGRPHSPDGRPRAAHRGPRRPRPTSPGVGRAGGDPAAAEPVPAQLVDRPRRRGRPAGHRVLIGGSARGRCCVPGGSCGHRTGVGRACAVCRAGSARSGPPRSDRSARPPPARWRAAWWAGCVAAATAWSTWTACRRAGPWLPHSHRTRSDRVLAPFATLGGGAEDYLAERPGKVRSTIKRTSKRFDRDGVEFVTVAATDIDAALDDLARLHESRWADGSVFLRGWERFGDAARAGAASGEVVVHELRDADGGAVAVELDLVLGDRVAFYQAGRRTEREWRGCGSVLRGKDHPGRRRTGGHRVRPAAGRRGLQDRMGDRPPRAGALRDGRGPRQGRGQAPRRARRPGCPSGTCCRRRGAHGGRPQPLSLATRSSASARADALMPRPISPPRAPPSTMSSSDSAPRRSSVGPADRPRPHTWR